MDLVMGCLLHKTIDLLKKMGFVYKDSQKFACLGSGRLLQKVNGLEKSLVITVNCCFVGVQHGEAAFHIHFVGHFQGVVLLSIAECLEQFAEIVVHF